MGKILEFHFSLFDNVPTIYDFTSTSLRFAPASLRASNEEGALKALRTELRVRLMFYSLLSKDESTILMVEWTNYLES